MWGISHQKYSQSIGDIMKLISFSVVATLSLSAFSQGLVGGKDFYQTNDNFRNMTDFVYEIDAVELQDCKSKEEQDQELNDFFNKCTASDGELMQVGYKSIRAALKNYPDVNVEEELLNYEIKNHLIVDKQYYKQLLGTGPEPKDDWVTVSEDMIKDKKLRGIKTFKCLSEVKVKNEALFNFKPFYSQVFLGPEYSQLNCVNFIETAKAQHGALNLFSRRMYYEWKVKRTNNNESEVDKVVLKGKEEKYEAKDDDRFHLVQVDNKDGSGIHYKKVDKGCFYDLPQNCQAMLLMLEPKPGLMCEEIDTTPDCNENNELEIVVLAEKLIDSPDKRFDEFRKIFDNPSAHLPYTDRPHTSDRYWNNKVYNYGDYMDMNKEGMKINKNKQTVFKFDFSKLDKRFAQAAAVKAAVIEMDLQHSDLDDADFTELFCSLDTKLCSGKLFVGNWTGYINKKFHDFSKPVPVSNKWEMVVRKSAQEATRVGYYHTEFDVTEPGHAIISKERLYQEMLSGGKVRFVIADDVYVEQHAKIKLKMSCHDQK